MAEICGAACRGPKAEAALRPLAIAFSITLGVFAAELTCGFWAGSLALLADAAHVAVDLAALGLGLFAAWAAARPPDAKRSFGYHRAEVLAALANGVGLWLIVGFLLREAWGRLGTPHSVRVGGMLAVAAAGLVGNLVSAAVLYKGAKESLNIRGVLLHALSDALGSLGAIGAGLVMWWTGWMGADAWASVFICAVILIASWGLVRDAVHILLEGTPEHLDLDAVRASLSGVDGVVEVHDLHLWSLSAGSESLSCHLVYRRGMDPHAVRRTAARVLEERFSLTHVTIQVEEAEKAAS